VKEMIVWNVPAEIYNVNNGKSLGSLKIHQFLVYLYDDHKKLI
jgi:hypothetical protein